jgi:hypothetical protein
MNFCRLCVISYGVKRGVTSGIRAGRSVRPSCCRHCRTTFVFCLSCVLLTVCLHSCKLDVELVGLIIACNQSAQRKRDVARFVYAYVIWLFF